MERKIVRGCSDIMTSWRPARQTDRLTDSDKRQVTGRRSDGKRRQWRFCSGLRFPRFSHLSRSLPKLSINGSVFVFDWDIPGCGRDATIVVDPTHQVNNIVRVES